MRNAFHAKWNEILRGDGPTKLLDVNGTEERDKDKFYTDSPLPGKLRNQEI